MDYAATQSFCATIDHRRTVFGRSCPKISSVFVSGKFILYLFLWI